MEAPNICKASTENDKHEVALAPITIPKLIPTCLNTTHDFLYSGAFLTDNSVDSPLTWTNVSAWGKSQEILSINLNRPFDPIDAMWLNKNSYGLSTTSAQIFEQYNGVRYFPQGINLYRNQYDYYKVEWSEWTIDFLNYQGFDGENPTVPVTVHTYHENNDTAIPTLTYNSNNGDDRKAMIALLANPRVGTICGGTPLGTCSVAGYSGLASETIVYPYAPELRTSFKWVNKCSAASDPTSVNNVRYWTAVSTTGGPGPVNKLHFFIMPHLGANFGNTSVIRPMFKIRARFNITWRDHAANSSIFTTTDV